MLNSKGVNYVEIIGVVALLAVIGLGAFAIIRPILNPGDQQKANCIVNNNYNAPRWGCANFSIRGIDDLGKISNTTTKRAP
jgi:hypothetical protein